MESSSSSDSKLEDVPHKNPRRTSSELLQGNSFSNSRRSMTLRSRRGLQEDSLTPEFDPNSYSAGQSLASILNNPQKGGAHGADSTWGSWFFSSSADPFVDGTPLLPSKALQEISRADLQSYLESISEAYGRFADVQDHLSREEEAHDARTASVNLIGGGQSEGLVACLREIPHIFFEESFALENGATFQAVCPFSSSSENVILQEKLSRYLDVVEVHLVKEISVRSDSFFEAQGQIEDLNSQIVEACHQIKDLKTTVKLLDEDLLEPADLIQSLKTRRDQLLGLHQKLKLVSYVNQAISALHLLVSAADCAGALDIIDDLHRLIESDDLVGLHCFRHLGEHLVSTMDAVNNMLAADFVRMAIYDTSDLEASAILLRFSEREKIPPKKVTSLEEEASLREQLLPLVIGLLRTSRLPAVLRIYKDTLVTDIKAAIKTTIAELLPVLFKLPSSGDLPSADRQTDMEVGGLSLANKLRALSAEAFVQLLGLVFGTVQDRLLRAAEVRKVIEEIVGGLKGSYAAEVVAAAFASGAAVAAAEAAQEEHQRPALVNSTFLLQEKGGPVSLSGNITASPSSISRQFRADVLRENTEAVCAACDTAHGRWAKLLGVRALIHPKLRLQEFVRIYSITQDFITDTEKVGGRLGYSIRGTLQSQAKSFVDFHHSTHMTKIVAVLEQDTWVAVDVPDEFQVLLNKLTSARFSTHSNEDSMVADENRVSEQPVESVGTSMSGQLDSMLPSNGSQKTEAALKLKTDKTAEIPENSLNPLMKTVEDPESEKEDAHVNDLLPQNKHLEEAERANGTVLNQANQIPVPSAVETERQVTTSRTKKTREKTSVKTLSVDGTSYHMVNSALILLKMVMEYVDISDALPVLATEVVHRVSEILKVFNSRSCQLVLGAGAMQVSGLKSITAKHLALASQSISFFYNIIPYIREMLSFHIPDTRKALLLTEVDRVKQDFRVHKDEIHSKLVQIMKERLSIHLRSFPHVVEEWNKVDESDSQPSHFARSLTKEVGVLHRVLSPLLFEEDVRSIFTRVVALFHSQLSDTFLKLELNSPQAKKRLYRDVQHILACMHGLPSEFNEGNGLQKPGELDRFLAENFGSEAHS